MPRGQHPNSRKALEENRKKGQFRGESAVKAAKKSNEVQYQIGNIVKDLQRQSTPEVIAEGNAKLIRAVKAGNLKAYEIWRDMMGEKPKDRVELSANDDMARMEDILRQMGMTDDGQSGPEPEV